MLYKLKNRRGETLLETLASLLIAAIAMLMFAEIIAATARVTKTGQSWNEDVSQRSNFLEKRQASSDTVKPYPGTITIDGLIEDTGVTFYVARYGGEDVISYASS